MAVAHQHNAVGHGHRLGLVVRHIDHRHSKPLLQPPIRSAFSIEPGVAIRKWLVHQTDARFRDNSAAECYPLPLATRQLRWLALEQLSETDDVRNTLEPRISLGRDTRRTRRPKTMFSATLRCGNRA